MLETLDHTIRIGSTPTFLFFDLYDSDKTLEKFWDILKVKNTLAFGYFFLYAFLKSDNFSRVYITEIKTISYFHKYMSIW